MDVRDLRQLAISVLTVGIVVLLWTLLLRLQIAGLIDFGPLEQALVPISMRGWLWIAVAFYVVLLVLFVVSYFGVPTTPPGYAEGTMRQVQCGDCHAVFFLHDTGHRPLTHLCPNCKAMGIYDGKTPPVGSLKQVRPMQDIPCGHCNTTLHVPYPVPESLECPACGAVGRPAG